MYQETAHEHRRTAKEKMKKMKDIVDWTGIGVNEAVQDRSHGDTVFVTSPTR